MNHGGLSHPISASHIKRNIRQETLSDNILASRLPEITSNECQEELTWAVSKVRGLLDRFVQGFPGPNTENGVYPLLENTDWTSSFWSGMLWLSYDATGDSLFRKEADAQLLSYRKRVEEKKYVDTHDLGFLYTLSCVACWRLTQNTEARDIALRAADLLMARYFDKAGIIQAWGDLNDPNNRGRLIIDCTMNLPLLYWASEQTGNLTYRNAAVSHLMQTIKYIIRDDASCFHTFYMDVVTGEPRFGKTCQGYSDDSSWARGQAWAIYGLMLSHRYTRDPELVRLATAVADYFLNRLPSDLVCYWDLIFTEGPEERDTSAAVIAVCGLLELAACLPLLDPKRTIYEKVVLRIMKSLQSSYGSKKSPEIEGLLMHAVYNKPGKCGIDECMIWGDYFYMEALIRLNQLWEPYW